MELQQEQQQQQQQPQRRATAPAVFYGSGNGGTLTARLTNLLSYEGARGAAANNGANAAPPTEPAPQASGSGDATGSSTDPSTVRQLREENAALWQDNRALAWECWHLQALLAHERALGAAAAQAAAIELAARCIRLQQEGVEARADLALALARGAVPPANPPQATESIRSRASSNSGSNSGSGKTTGGRRSTGASAEQLTAPSEAAALRALVAALLRPAASEAARALAELERAQAHIAARAAAAADDRWAGDVARRLARLRAAVVEDCGESSCECSNNNNISGSKSGVAAGGAPLTGDANTGAGGDRTGRSSSSGGGGAPPGAVHQSISGAKGRRTTTGALAPAEAAAAAALVAELHAAALAALERVAPPPRVAAP